MKKILYTFLLCGLTIFSFAQEEATTPEQAVKEPKAKATNNLLPSAGDIAIGVDALPYIEFLGNMFSGYAGKNRLNLGQTTIYGKYYLSPNKAIRGELFLDNSTTTDQNYVQDDANVGTNPNAQVEDQRVTKQNGFGLGVGYQQYRGYGKLRGTYGAMLSFYHESEAIDYKYGNQMTALNATPTTTNWPATSTFNPAERNLMRKTYGDNTLSLGLIAGVEYFFVPKVCVGGELGIYFNGNWSKQEYRKFQTVEAGSVSEYEIAIQPKEVQTSLTTNVYNTNFVAGRLYLLFHF